MKTIGMFLIVLLAAIVCVGVVVGYALFCYSLTKINHHEVALRITAIVSTALAPFAIGGVIAFLNDL